MPDIYPGFSPIAAQATGPNVMSDPLIQPIVGAVDERMNDMVSGISDAANLSIGFGIAAAGAGLAIGGAALGVAIARSDAPYDCNHISIAQAPAIGSAQDMQMRGNDAAANSLSVAAEPLPGNAELPAHALQEIRDIARLFKGAFGGIDTSERDLGGFAPAAAARDGAIEHDINKAAQQNAATAA